MTLTRNRAEAVNELFRGHNAEFDRICYAVRGRLVDFHTHILPGMDDGSRSVDESIKMLEMSAGQGVGCVILTPHFYASSDNPERFLERRSRSLAKLNEQIHSEMPLLIQGAEVQYFSGITTMEELLQLRIEGTELLLLEMPFQKWSSRVIDDVFELNKRRGIQVIIAHIERYIGEQPKGTLEALAENHILIQVNAEFFRGCFNRRKALSMVKNGYVHLLGTDCHNMTSRSPMLGSAFQTIRDRLGESVADELKRYAVELLLSQYEKTVLRKINSASESATESETDVIKL